MQANAIALPRAAGVLLHPTSLPGPTGVGDLGKNAYAFVDWLAHTRIGLWQILPLVPTGAGGSPYSSWSAFAGNPDLVDLEGLAEVGLLDIADVRAAPRFAPDVVDYGAARAFRSPLLLRAATRLLENKSHPWRSELEAFQTRNAAWLETTTLFQALSEKLAAPFWQWPAPLRDREPAALAEATTELRQRLDVVAAVQFFFDHQWRALRGYAIQRGVRLIGDVPIYVDHNSADVWANRHLFELDKNGQPHRVAGVPPDAFSANGQRWGNPLYRWDVMQKDGYAFWAARLGRALELTDWVRIDHFRGLAAYWAVPAEAPDATTGTWVPGPGAALFAALEQKLGKLPIIAEDLGVIDEPVRQLLAETGMPGMKVLQFAFGESAANAYLPHNHVPRSVVYTGTHDNDTTLGWWHVQDERTKHHFRLYFGVDGSDAVWTMVRAALASVAGFAVIPMQDLLGLDGSARMNTPAIADGNWRWRMLPDGLRGDVSQRLRDLIEIYGRC